MMGVQLLSRNLVEAKRKWAGSTTMSFYSAILLVKGVVIFLMHLTRVSVLGTTFPFSMGQGDEF